MEGLRPIWKRSTYGRPVDDADDLPGWVKPIVDSLVPVHKFSKYMPVFVSLNGVRLIFDFHAGTSTGPRRYYQMKCKPCPTGPTSRP